MRPTERVVVNAPIRALYDPPDTWPLCAVCGGFASVLVGTEYQSPSCACCQMWAVGIILDANGVEHPHPAPFGRVLEA